MNAAPHESRRKVSPMHVPLSHQAKASVLAVSG
jgi:hypothetical protein